MYKTRYAYDNAVFDEVNDKSAYWIGFIMCDGYVNGNRLQIGVAKQDKDILRQFKDFIKSPDRPIRNFMSNYSYPVCELRIRSWDYKHALDRYGMNRLKKDRDSIDIALIQEGIRRHFMRGVFDADGTFTVDNRGYMFAEMTGYKGFLRGIKNILVADGIISEKKKITKNGKIFRLRLSASDTLKLGEYLYKGYPDIYCSKRKHNIFKSHAERLNNTTEHPKYALKRQSKHKTSGQSKIGTKANKKSSK